MLGIENREVHYQCTTLGSHCAPPALLHHHRNPHPMGVVVLQCGMMAAQHSAATPWQGVAPEPRRFS